MNNPLVKNETQYIHYTDTLAIKTVSDTLITCIPQYYSNIVVLCIGTDRSTGDSLGPLTGTFLSKMNLKNIDVYGTLHEPVHAINLQDNISNITRIYKKPFIIAVDASLGRSNSIGCIASGAGSLQPGAALNKKLPSVGDAYITGVVNVGGFMDYAVLQSTRLSIVHDMSYKLAHILKRIDIWLNYYQVNVHKSSLHEKKCNTTK